jgi:hypothetical protein
MSGEVHPFFSLLCERFLQLHPSMTRRIWGRLYPSEVHTLIVQAEFSERSPSPEGISLLAQRIPPKLLLAACQRLSPADGRRRERYVIEAEELILARVGPDGQWV